MCRVWWQIQTESNDRRGKRKFSNDIVRMGFCPPEAAPDPMIQDELR